ncbi:MAG: hypothetical protein M1831_002447 [Alyxoria varia]|nr:MAG: hypothetical protein M1831_002447 [Alyxoria varia]
MIGMWSETVRLQGRSRGDTPPPPPQPPPSPTNTREGLYDSSPTVRSIPDYKDDSELLKHNISTGTMGAM